ncbi:MAG: PQQ-dependent sugar dehydrogenase, partial [Thermoanaerobaculia bacterium]
VRVVLLALALAAPAAAASLLPGFRVERVAGSEGFVTSIAFDRHGNLYYSVTEGGIFRLEGERSIRIATLPTASTGNAVLLGIAFRDDEIVAHYVTPDITADIVAAVDPKTGEERELARFLCAGGSPCSTEHHGGNPIVGPDGTIWLGIGDYGVGLPAQLDGFTAGRIWRIPRDGEPEAFARGFRNPYDLLLHPSGDYLIVGDNGSAGGDEIAFVREGENHGWPMTMGNEPAIDGMTPPAYVFPTTVAPTGMTLARDLVPNRTALLVGSYVPNTLFLFPDVDAAVLEPIPILADLPQLGTFRSILDVVQAPTGEILFATPLAIWRLHLPLRGDVNGDGTVAGDDLEALAHELVDGDGPAITDIHLGEFAATWGADVNEDAVVDSRDLVAWVLMQESRHRPVVRP